MSLDNLKEKFNRLAEEWKSTICSSSSAKVLCDHPAYHEIISMGLLVVPLILEEIKKEYHHWFIALYRITKATPVKDEHRGNLKLMSKDWLKWGVKQGIIADDKTEWETKGDGDGSTKT